MHVQRNTFLIWRLAFLTSMRFNAEKNLLSSPPWPSPSPRLPCRHRRPRRRPLSPSLFPSPSPMPSPSSPFLLFPRLVDCCLIIVVVTTAVSVAIAVAVATVAVAVATVAVAAATRCHLHYVCCRCRRRPHPRCRQSPPFLLLKR
jgi:hypothetical protein